jgi:hypothetical protein
MSTVLDADLQRSASHRNMVEQLTAPFAAGAVDSPIPIDANGVATIPWTSRECLLVAAPAVSLGSKGLLLATAKPAGAEAARFLPYTEKGAFVLLRKPTLDTTGHVAPFSVTLALWELDEEGHVGNVVAQNGIASLVGLSLVEGIFGQVAFVLGSEKQRLRRQSRVLEAARRLDGATRAALDGLGADLGVPRFDDELTYSGGQIYAKTAVSKESDASYRRRLRIYRPWWQPTRANVVRALNGAPPSTAPNAGPIAELPPPLTARFSVDDKYAPFAVAIKIVSAGGAARKTKFLDWVRALFLVWPVSSGTANSTHAKRYLSTGARARVNGVRQAMRALFDFYIGDAAVAPALADALVRAGRCRKALGLTPDWELARAQESGFGSRYELGLGALVGVMTQQELQNMATAVQSQTRPAAPDPDVEAILQGIASRGAPPAYAADPEGRWLLEPCGLQTVRQVSSQYLYVSHLPNYGLQIDGPDDVSASGWTAIVPLHLYGDASMRLAFYERSSGTLEVYSTGTVEGAGLTGKLTTSVGTNWTHVISGTWSFQGLNALLFYDAAAGTFATYDVTSTAIASRSNNLPTRPGLTHLAPVYRNGYTNLLLYDSATGEVDFVLCQKPMKFDKVWTDKTVPRSWTGLIADGTHAVAYDRRAGQLMFMTIGPKGLEVDGELDGLPVTWSDLCLMENGFGLHDPEADTFTAAVYDSSGVLAWRDPVVLPAEATRVVYGSFGEQVPANLVLYDRIGGTGTFLAVDPGAGSASVVRTLTQWRAAGSASYTVTYHEAADAPGPARLQAALTAARTAWGVHAPAAWTVVPAAQVDGALALAQANPTLRDVLQRAALPALQDPLPTVQAIRAALQANPSSAAVLKLDPAFRSELLAGSGTEDLRALADTLADEQLASAFAVATTAPDVLVVVSGGDLPGVGATLATRNASGFQWYLVPLAGRRGRLTPVRGGVAFSPADDGVSALIAVGYSRRGSNRPYEFRVDLPAGATLSIEQYEFLMNVLQHAYPVGVAVNTYALRRQHVDLNGDGSPDPLPPTISRTFRSFRRRRRSHESMI